MWHNVQTMLNWLCKNKEETEEEKESKDDRTVTVTNYVFTKCNIVYVNIHIDALLKTVFRFCYESAMMVPICMYVFICLSPKGGSSDFVATRAKLLKHVPAHIHIITWNEINYIRTYSNVDAASPRAFLPQLRDIIVNTIAALIP